MRVLRHLGAAALALWLCTGVGILVYEIPSTLAVLAAAAVLWTVILRRPRRDVMCGRDMAETAADMDALSERLAKTNRKHVNLNLS